MSSDTFQGYSDYVILMFKKVIFMKEVSIVTALLMRLIMKVKFVVLEK